MIVIPAIDLQGGQCVRLVEGRPDTATVFGDDPVAMARLRPDGPPPDLVVLDLMLPKVDGFAILKAARQRRVHTPVLILTARDSVADKVRGLDLGADDYLTKPFAFDEFLARVDEAERRTLQLEAR